MRFIVLFIFSINIYSSPWLTTDDHVESLLIKRDLKLCDYKFKSFLQHYPISYQHITRDLKNKKEFLSESCKGLVDGFIEKIESSFAIPVTKIGYQSKVNTTYFQSIGKRYYQNEMFYISHSRAINNFAFKVKVSQDLDKKKYYFDESFISYKLGNTILSVGRVSRWWSPSEKFSLILSNSARPSYGFELKNYAPISPKRFFFKFLGQIDYEFFFNQLEKDRAIPNTLLYGNRVSIKPNKHLDISFVRIAQFGGDGRPTDSSTILNMLIGRDNYSTEFINDQPGNQLAGIDFSFSPKNASDLRLYGQIVGEDEAGYLPSKTLTLLGYEHNTKIFQTPAVLSFDYVDTYSGKKNYSYNHNLYLDGLRYYKRPIGASIDADSKIKVFAIKTFFNNLIYEASFQNTNLNKNSSEYNYWLNDKASFNQVNLKINMERKKYNIELILIARDKELPDFKKNNFLLNFEYKF